MCENSGLYVGVRCLLEQGYDASPPRFQCDVDACTVCLSWGFAHGLAMADALVALTARKRQLADDISHNGRLLKLARRRAATADRAWRLDGDCLSTALAMHGAFSRVMSLVVNHGLCTRPLTGCCVVLIGSATVMPTSPLVQSCHRWGSRCVCHCLPCIYARVCI